MRHDSVLLTRPSRFATAFDIQMTRVYPQFQVIKRTLPINDFWTLVQTLLEDGFCVDEDITTDGSRQIWLLRIDDSQKSLPPRASGMNVYTFGLHRKEAQVMKRIAQREDRYWFQQMYCRDIA